MQASQASWDSVESLTPYQHPSYLPKPLPIPEKLDFNDWVESLSDEDFYKLIPHEKPGISRIHHHKDNITDYYPPNINGWQSGQEARIATTEQHIGTAFWCGLPPGQMGVTINRDDVMQIAFKENRQPLQRKEVQIVPDEVPAYENVRELNRLAYTHKMQAEARRQRWAERIRIHETQERQRWSERIREGIRLPDAQERRETWLRRQTQERRDSGYGSGQK
jgi:hypothetical protein